MAAKTDMSARFYRLLLRIYPAHFRARFEPDMTDTFESLARERRTHGFVALAVLWLRTLADALANGIGERMNALRGRPAAPRRGRYMWHAFRHDLRYALRTIRRSPAVAAIVVITMALGIGASSAIFSVVRAVILRPLPFADPGGLYTVWVDVPSGAKVASGWLGPQLGDRLVPVAPPYLADLRARATSFSKMAGVSPTWNLTLTGAGSAAVVQALYVSDRTLEVLGLAPLAGRDFVPEEHVQGGPRAVLVAQSIWRQIGGQGAPDGRPIMLNGEAYAVVGLLPDAAQLPGTPGDIWIPFAQNQFVQARQVGLMTVLARLKSGVSDEAARSELQSVAQSLERDFPASKGQGLALVPFAERVSRRVRPLLIVLGASVALLTLIAVANVANLLLARASTRQREIAVRTALGAGRWRIVRQVLTESVLLAVAGAMAGVVMAYWSLGTLVTLLTNDLPPRADVRLDWQVLAFSGVVALGAGLLFGLAPAFEALRGASSDALRHGARAGEGGRRIRQSLVAAEVALAFVLLIGAGLLIRSFWKLSAVNPGFRTDNVVSVPIGLPAGRYPTSASCLQFFDRLLPAVQSLPGIESAALVNRLPLGGATNNAVDMQIEGRPAEPEPNAMNVDRRVGSPDYFKTMAIPVVGGRAFDDRDTAAGPGVAIVNQSMARRYWGAGDPLGARLRIQLLSGPGPWLTIVGVVGDVRHHGLAAEVRPEVWVPYSQAPVSGVVLVARTAGDVTPMLETLRRTIQKQDPELPVTPVTLQAVVATSIQSPRSRTSLLSTFAGLALVLAIIGVAGVVAYTVSKSVRDIGVRMALGAERRDILRLVLWQGLTPAAIGVIAGIAGALAGTRVLSGMLFGVGRGDPLTYATVAVGLVATAALACLLPATRATRVDPVSVLRVD
jgi:putative ABC transport system permease protein